MLRNLVLIPNQWFDTIAEPHRGIYLGLIFIIIFFAFSSVTTIALIILLHLYRHAYVKMTPMDEDQSS